MLGNLFCLVEVGLSVAMTLRNKSSNKEIPMKLTLSLLSFFISLSVFAKELPFGAKPKRHSHDY